MSQGPFPKKRLSQNFLTDANIARKIVGSLDVQEGDTVLEIGCGRGALTRWLLEEPCSVHGIEVDSSLIPLLKDEFGSRPNFTLHEGDVLCFDPSAVPAPGRLLKLIGNLPYHIASPILFRVMEWGNLLERAVLMIQKEVADRVAHAPGSREYGLLSVFCQYHAECRVLFDVPPAAFFPRPKVTSAILEWRPRTYPVQPADYGRFAAVVKRAFNQRRKMLRNSLSPMIRGREVSFDLQRRPEELSVDDFVQLSNLLTP